MNQQDGRRRPAQAEVETGQVNDDAKIGGQQGRDGGGQRLADVKLNVRERRGEQGFERVALFFADEAFEGDDQRDRDREEADDHQQERDEALADDGRAVVGDELHRLAGGEVHQRREEQGEGEDGGNDAPIAEAVADFAAGDHEGAAEI